MIELNKIYHGNCLDLFKWLDNESIDCVITSPPYWQLRDYKWDGQWGLESTFQEYLEHLWQMMDEVWRVLKPTGTAWINLGDTYSASVPTGGNGNKLSESQSIKRIKSNVPDKCLLLIPHRFAIGLIDRGWIVRNDIIWAKKNGMPESVTDRFSKKHEYIFLVTKKQKYYFDLDSIREKQSDVSLKRYQYDFTGQEGGDSNNYKGSRMRDKSKEKYNYAFLQPLGKGARPEMNVNGKNPGDVSDFWDIITIPSSDEHYASYNDRLIGRPIIAGCPKGGTVLDPFCGSGTTGCRAIELGRNFIGFEGSEKFVKMGNKNIAPYLQQTNMFH
jgi:DNA modification methylase